MKIPLMLRKSRFSLAILWFVVSIALPVFAQSGVARTVKYSQQDVIAVRAKLRYSTLIVLPQDEDILDFATGDKDFWIINGAHNLCYIHPAQAGIRSDLHLITASGHVYSFLLTEISNEPTVEPDLKLFVEPKEESSIGGNSLLQGYVRAGEAEAYKKELDALHTQTDERIHAAEAHATEQSRQVQNRLFSEAPVRLRTGQERFAGALPGVGDLPRRLLHLYQVRRPRETGPLRNQGRQAEPHQLSA